MHINKATLCLVLVLNGILTPSALACNCISNGSASHLVNTYLGITLLISLLPIVMASGGIWVLYRMSRNHPKEKTPLVL